MPNLALPLQEFMPFPWNTLQLPATDAVCVDTVGPMIEHCAGLAMACCLALP